jgi:hypothetical protein
LLASAVLAPVVAALGCRLVAPVPVYYAPAPYQPVAYQPPPPQAAPAYQPAQPAYPPAQPAYPPAQPAYPPAQPEAAGSQTVVQEGGRSITLEHGPAGDPSIVGCADGRREAFLDTQRYPAIAGCLGTWGGRQSLRTPPTGAACGDELGPCAVPADVCAPGWHVCGSSGAVADLRQVSAEECERAGGGRFAAGISHCQSQQGCGVDPRPEARYNCYAHGWCSEPVCCGRDCGEFGSCRSGVWPEKTHIPFGQDQGCASTGSQRAGGVLCCR